MEIQFLKSIALGLPNGRTRTYDAGNVVTLDKETATHLVARGVAVAMQPEPEPIADPKPKRAVKVI